MSEIPELDRITDKVLAYRPAKQNQQKGDGMAEVRTMDIDGEERQVVERPFEIRREVWSEYEFADGGGVRFKTVVKRIWQVLDDDGKPARHDNGDLVLIAESQNIVVADTS